MGIRVTIKPLSECIPDFACVAVCPEVFIPDEELGKARIKGGENRGDSMEAVIPSHLKPCVEMAASLCPRGIITVEDSVEGP
ncbi:MAG: ferredoxin [Aeropyrum sp.]|nr:ferredoxin [Aeropyrum sp.]